MNILENIKNFFTKENPTDSKITKEEIGKRKILKAIFGKEFVQDEELWKAGFGACGDLIEVESKNISFYCTYSKKSFILEKIGKVETSRRGKLPEGQKAQIEAVMKIIAYSAVSLQESVEVENMTEATIQFLRNLGYKVLDNTISHRITWENAKKVEDNTRYLTAKTALALSDYINTYILVKFLEEKILEGKEYVIIPIKSMLKDKYYSNQKQNARNILDSLNLDYDLDTLVSAHEHKSLAFICLKNINTSIEMHKTSNIAKYLPVKL